MCIKENLPMRKLSICERNELKQNVGLDSRFLSTFFGYSADLKSNAEIAEILPS